MGASSSVPRGGPVDAPHRQRANEGPWGPHQYHQSASCLRIDDVVWLIASVLMGADRSLRTDLSTSRLADCVQREG